MSAVSDHPHPHDAAHPHSHSHAADSTSPQENPRSHARGHYHSPEEKKRQLNRLSRLIGHLQHVRTMIENDEDCADVLMQLSAVRSAINGLGKEIVNEHITHCISHAMEDGDTAALDAFKRAINLFI